MNPDDFIKVKSILDVWFDSGSSHVYVLKIEELNVLIYTLRDQINIEVGFKHP